MDILIYICLHTLNMWLLKNLSINENPTEVTLLLRGLGCISLSILFAWQKNYSLIPNKPKLQLMRLFIAGFGLALMIGSYNYINASTIAVLLKFDVIFLIFISTFLKRELKEMSFYALGAFVLLSLIHI